MFLACTTNLQVSKKLETFCSLSEITSGLADWNNCLRNGGLLSVACGGIYLHSANTEQQNEVAPIEARTNETKQRFAVHQSAEKVKFISCPTFQQTWTVAYGLY